MINFFISNSEREGFSKKVTEIITNYLKHFLNFKFSYIISEQNFKGTI